MSQKNKPNRSKIKEISNINIFILVSICYLFCIIVYFYHYFGHFTDSLIGPPEDNMQDFWNTRYSQVTIDTNFNNFFHTNIIKYPDGTSLYYHSFSYSNILIIYAIRKLLSLPIKVPLLVGLHNGLLLLSFYLAAIGAFYLTRRFTKKVLPAFVSGFIFAFSPFHVAHFLHHMHVATIQYIPFFLICFFSFVDTRKLRYLAGSILFYFLSAISCWYYLFYIGYFMMFYYIYKMIEDRRFLIRSLYWPMFANIVGVVILLLPLLVPMVLEKATNDPRSVIFHNVFGADLVGYITFHPYHIFSKFSRPIYSYFGGNLWEKTVYLGLINLGLFIWAFVNKNRLHISEMSFLLWGIIIFMLLASGPYLTILNNDTIPLPTAIIPKIPLIKNVRTPARAVVFVYLFLGIGVGLAIDAIMDKYSSQKMRLFALLSIICILIFVDFYATGLEMTRVVCPKAYNLIIHDEDPDFGILDLPKEYGPGNVYMMYQAACHWKPIVVANVSRKTGNTLSDRLELTDINRQKEQLVKNKVKYIVIHKYIAKNLEEYGKYIDSYPVVYSDNYNIILRVY